MKLPNMHPYKLFFNLDGYECDAAEGQFMNAACSNKNANREEK